MIKECVSVTIDDDCDAFDPTRLFINNGSQHWSKNFEDGYPLDKYLDHAYIPKLTWRLPTDIERTLLFTKSAHDSAKHIGIIKLPKSMMSDFIEIGIHRTDSYQDLIHLHNTAKFKQALTNIILYLDRYFNDPSSIVFKQIGHRPPGLVSATFDTVQQLYVGLHFDSFDTHNPLNVRHLSQNRISINMGRGERWLYFINLDVKTICSMLNIDINDPEKKIGFLQRAFFQSFSQYPVCRVRIDPGEAYIAPTENILHDGTTLFTDTDDLTMVVHGDISIQSLYGESSYD